MKFSGKSAADQPSKAPPVVLAAAGGQPYVRRPTPSPMQSWMDLMELVEMLCPRWPIRTVVRGTRYLL